MKATAQHPYPKTFEEFLEWFQSEEDCEKYLGWIRWAEGFTCPQCKKQEAWKTERGLWYCKNCQLQTSVKVGTVFEGSHKPLRLWFHVIWLMMSQKTGMSAQNLCDTYGFGSYQTAWGWLQKLRSVMIRGGREHLRGRVEVDEAYIGGKRAGPRGRGAEGKTLVLVAVEGSGRKFGRVRFRCVQAADATTLNAFICDYVEPGSVIVTDGLLAYSGLQKAGFLHQHHVTTGDDTAREQLDHVHLVISLTKRWLIGTHQGAIKPTHLQAYLDEFAFRFNRRLSTHRGKLFHRLIQQAVASRPKNIKDFYTVKPLHIVAT